MANYFLRGKRVEKQIVNIFLFFRVFNYYMIKSWGASKVTVLTLIGNYFLISIFNRIVFWFA